MSGEFLEGGAAEATAARQYREAGVDLASADDAKHRIATLVAATQTPLAIGKIGAFGGMLRLPADLRKPVLVLSTDGVGTKVMVAAEAGRLDTVGEDLVNHSVNDIVVHGATPLAFMDYIAGAALGASDIADIVTGVARGCRAHGMSLAGGETAQMPGLYRPGTFDLAGTIVGVVEEDRAIHGDAIVPGDVLVGYASSGLHTNGYTLARRIVFDLMQLRHDAPFPGGEGSVADVLLAVHRSYWPALRPVLGLVHGMAHITGGGIAGNLVRVLPPGCEAVIDADAWEWPSLFRTLQKAGDVSTAEMREVFNLGLGLLAAVPPGAVAEVREAATAADVSTWVVGAVQEGERGVRFTPA